jgi:hypothetical protein
VNSWLASLCANVNKRQVKSEATRSVLLQSRTKAGAYLPWLASSQRQRARVASQADLLRTELAATTTTTTTS